MEPAPPVPPTELTAGRLHLRPWRAADADAVLTACQDRQIQRWTPVPCPYTAEHARSFVQDAAPQGWADGRDYGFAVCDSESGDLLGAVAVRCRRRELGGRLLDRPGGPRAGRDERGARGAVPVGLRRARGAAPDWSTGGAQRGSPRTPGDGRPRQPW